MAWCDMAGLLGKYSQRVGVIAIVLLLSIAPTSEKSSLAARALVWLVDSTFIFPPYETELVLQNQSQQDSLELSCWLPCVSQLAWG